MKKVTSILMAFVLMLTLIPTAWAEGGSVKEWTAADSLPEYGTYKLMNDVTLTNTHVVKGELNLDLNGKTVKNEADLWNATTGDWSLISVRGNGSLTITGSGKLHAKENDCYAIDLYDDDAKCVIEDGTFIGNISAVYVIGGQLEINGGEYSIQQKSETHNDCRFTLNCYDSAYKAGNAKITVKGGTFTEFNPENNLAEGKGTNFVHADYKSVKGEGETYTVVPKDYVAQIGDTKYVTLADAVAVGGDIKLLKDVAMDSTLVLNKDTTLDLNGHKITNGTSLGTDYLIKITKEANVSIVGNKEGSAIADARNNKTGTITAISIYGKLVVDGDALTISRGTNGIALKVDEDSGKQGILVVKSGTITSTQAIQNWGSTTIDGGVLNGDVDSFAYLDLGGDMTINAGTFNGSVYSAQLKYGGKWPTVSAKTTITGGNFKGIIAEYYNDGTNGVQPVERVEKPTDTAESVLIVTGGTFNTNPKDYVPTTGYTVAKKGDVYTVAKKDPDKDGTGETTSAVKLEVPATSGEAVINTTVDQNDIETNKELTVTNGKTAVTINQAGVAAIGAGADLDLSIKADSKTPESANTAAYNKAMAGKDANSALVVNISLTSGANKLFTTDVAGAYALVTVPYSTDKADKLTVYYLNGSDATALTKVVDAAAPGAAVNTFSYDAPNKLITLKLPHFSEYLISTTATRSVVHHYGGSGTTTTTGTKTNSPGTFDAGVGIYAVSAILSVTGMAWVGTKQRKH